MYGGKKTIFRYSKELIPSAVNLSCELERISLVYESESLKSRVMYSLLICFLISMQNF